MPHVLRSFLPIGHQTEFPLENLPYGIFSTANTPNKRVGTIVGNTVIDLAELETFGLFEYCYDRTLALFNQSTLSFFAAQPKTVQKKIRQTLQYILSIDNPTLRDNDALCQRAFHPYADVFLHVPAKIPNYTDFYSSIDHARNVGRLFRDKDQPLLPNYLHLPVAYHGRASSIVCSGHEIRRPQGQILPPNETTPILAPTRALDFELEMAFFIGQGNPLGEPINIENSYEHILGLVILNDWSARDIQKWEYVPLGPFLSKSFATTISPWVVTLDALEPFKIKPREQELNPLAYLQYEQDFTLDIHLEVAIKTATMTTPMVISRSNFSYLYWTMAQQLAHHSIAGCNMETMDLVASGTISGPEPQNAGSLLEITEGGKKNLVLSQGETRMYLEDGDEVIMTAFCQGDNYRIGFGEARGRIESKNTK
ncbi:MAG: fumarylacetoacetase [Gammaproteobacteria bacterium]|nr:fumarylacetoacetase [Gammaproteobacteria bacterium]